MMRKLIDELNTATAAYDMGRSIMTDKEWDDKYFALKQMEEIEGYTFPDSPTQNIPYAAWTSLPKVEHNHPMLSLAKTKSLDEVRSFLGGEDFLCMAKMDGLTGSLFYENGELIRAETRGNGSIGEDVTHNAIHIASIPNHIPYKDRLVIDGEFICTKRNFDLWNEKHPNQQYKNPRNYASGSIRLLNSKEFSERMIDFIAWDVIEGFGTGGYVTSKLEDLKVMGFSIVPYHGSIVGSLDDHVAAVQHEVDRLTYPIDGMVFKFDSKMYGDSLGATSHHFKNAIAYKFYDETYMSRMRDIEWGMGRTGVLTPVAIFDPVDIDGTEVERASLHNVSVMYETLGGGSWVGQEVEIFKSNMIIPQICWANNKPPKDAKYIPMAEVCPVCGAPVELRTSAGNVKNLYCSSSSCSGKLINRLDHFLGKKGLDIKGLSKMTLEKLIAWGWVNTIPDVFNLRDYVNEWMRKPGFGEKSVSKVIDAIEAGKHCKLSAFISAIGIPEIGTTQAKELCKVFKSYEDFRNAVNDSSYNFTVLNGFGDVMNMYIKKFSYEEADMIAPLLTFETIIENEKTIEGSSLEGLTFVITGKLTSGKWKNRDALKAEIEGRGGKVANAVTKKTDYLIANAEESTSKYRNAVTYKIPIITEQNFLENF